tara:strand:- start:6167 stop:6430 length:264 start_codon:yes stop_codon:yes gene_type:complete
MMSRSEAVVLLQASADQRSAALRELIRDLTTREFAEFAAVWQMLTDDPKVVRKHASPAEFATILILAQTAFAQGVLDYNELFDDDDE